ncbi:MAG: helix-turn-helix transcriptional regulator [Bacteroidota bacterium]
MKTDIPRINFDKSQNLGIEVMSFNDLVKKLSLSKGHNPYAIHRIEFFLILMVTRGAYTHFVDFELFRLTKGSTLFVSKNQIHHFTKDLKECEGFCIIFRNELNSTINFSLELLKLNRIFNYHLGSPVVHQNDMNDDSLVGLGANLYREYLVSSRFAKAEILSALLQALLLKAERAKAFQSISGIKIHWLDLFNRFKNRLEKEYTTTRNSRAYAKELFISYKFLNEIVKKLTGKTAKAFIDDYVIIEIKRYLVSTPLSVKEISYKTGFDEPGNHVKFFKKNTGVTPLKFRQQFQ